MRLTAPENFDGDAATDRPGRPKSSRFDRPDSQVYLFNPKSENVPLALDGWNFACLGSRYTAICFSHSS